MELERVSERAMRQKKRDKDDGQDGTSVDEFNPPRAQLHRAPLSHEPQRALPREETRRGPNLSVTFSQGALENVGPAQADIILLELVEKCGGQ